MISAITSLYGPRYATVLVYMLQATEYHAGKYLAWYWRTSNFSGVMHGHVLKRTQAARMLLVALQLGMLAEIAGGIVLIVLGATGVLTSGIYFGAAAIIGYPVVWAHTLALGAFVWKVIYFVAHPKKLGRLIVCTILESQVKRLRQGHDFTVVAVAGSVGKTSTKLAIADLLSQTLRVRWQAGNYNDRVTVPLVFFGREEISLFNVFAWWKVFRANKRAIAEEFPYDVVVVELGTDGPGQMQQFAYIRPDVAVLTAISPEHMEFFKNLDAVAAEETTVFDYSKQMIVNGDDVPAKYLVDKEFKEYSLKNSQADYFAKATPEDLSGQTVHLSLPSGKIDAVHVQYVGLQGAKFALAASAVAHELEVKNADIKKGLQHLHHFAGRMQILPGARNSTIIDDTYNSSPLAAKAALDVLYAAKAEKRIAILGSMNELGDYSPEAHREVGEYCDPEKLDLVITIGNQAEKYLASVAKKQGCTVKSFTSPYEAGRFALENLEGKTVVLAKGSQNGVFAEEAVKILLADRADAAELVRQSTHWLSVKHKQFPNG